MFDRLQRFRFMHPIHEVIRRIVTFSYSNLKIFIIYFFINSCNPDVCIREQHKGCANLRNTMKTHDLVLMLATDVEPSDPLTLEKRFGLALLIGLLGGIFLLVVSFGIRSDMPQMLVTPLFWMKLAYPLAMLTAALFIAGRLSRPGGHAGFGWLALVAPLLMIWLAGALYVAAAPPELRLALVLGSSWRVCAMNIVFLSLPTFGAMFWAIRGLASTQPITVGAAAGLVAGAQGLLIYTLYCTEMAVPFWGVWYGLGMLIPTIAGGYLGTLLLRW
jgi:hypothetical protein